MGNFKSIYSVLYTREKLIDRKIQSQIQFVDYRWEYKRIFLLVVTVKADILINNDFQEYKSVQTLVLLIIMKQPSFCRLKADWLVY